MDSIVNLLYHLYMTKKIYWFYIKKKRMNWCIYYVIDFSFNLMSYIFNLFFMLSLFVSLNDYLEERLHCNWDHLMLAFFVKLEYKSIRIIILAQPATPRPPVYLTLIRMMLNYDRLPQYCCCHIVSMVNALRVGVSVSQRWKKEWNGDK